MPDASQHIPVLPVILSGGSGTRLWPLSRDTYPKQFLKLTGPLSLFQQTALRCHDVEGFLPPLIICNEAHRFIVRDQLDEIGLDATAILLEPEGRSTAPAALTAAHFALGHDDTPLLLVMPADHLLTPNEEFTRSVTAAAATATSRVVTFGITPRRPDTGLGYIVMGAKLPGVSLHEIDQFVEKPGLQAARQLLQQDNVVWNAGIFLFSAHILLREADVHLPGMASLCGDALRNAKTDLSFLRLAAEPWAHVQGISLDYGVMEKTAAGAVMPLDVSWSDVGSFDGLWRVLRSPYNQTDATVGPHMTIGTADNLIISEHPLVAVSGVTGLAIIATKDVVLVAPREDAETIRHLVTQTRLLDDHKVSDPPVAHRPWGHFETLDEGTGFKVKRLTIKPGSRLSLQSHKKRAEHWIVVQGQAKIARDGEVIYLNKNESTYISPDMKHRLENIGEIDLHVIEVQTGEYLEEDDIQRFDDAYGRSGKPE